MRIEVVYALPDNQQLIDFRLPADTCARSALLQVLELKLLKIESLDDPRNLPIGVYGQQVADDYVLQDGDRLEIYRPLLQDPKERRRQQAQKSSTGPSPSARFSQK